MNKTGLAGRRVLIFEDEPLIALDLEELCLEHGASEAFTIRRIEDAGDVDARRFDVAVVDLMLGGHSTASIAAALQAASVPIVFASGYAEAPEIRAAFPGVALVSKPYSSETMINALFAALATNSP